MKCQSHSVAFTIQQKAVSLSHKLPSPYAHVGGIFSEYLQAYIDFNKFLPVK